MTTLQFPVCIALWENSIRQRHTLKPRVFKSADWVIFGIYFVDFMYLVWIGDTACE